MGGWGTSTQIEMRLLWANQVFFLKNLDKETWEDDKIVKTKAKMA
jgi:hypothetical protein